MVGPRSAICKLSTEEQIMVAKLGQNERFTIVITEYTSNAKAVVKRKVYDNCLLTSLDFPTLSASGGEILRQ